MNRLPLIPPLLLSAACLCQSQGGDAPFPPKGKFQVENSIAVPVPAGSKEVRVWFPLPRVEDGQIITDLKVDAPDGWKEATDNQGNRYVYAVVEKPGDSVAVKTTFTVERREQ